MKRLRGSATVFRGGPRGWFITVPRRSIEFEILTDEVGGVFDGFIIEACKEPPGPRQRTCTPDTVA